MKKKFMLLLLPLTLLCGCNNSGSIAKKHYLNGEEAAPIRQELSNKLKTAAENFSWKGFEEKLEFDLKGNLDIVGSESIKLNAALNESTKVVLDENELKATNPNYAKVAKLESKMGMELKASSTVDNRPVSISTKYDITAKYGYSTIKPVDSETTVSSDFLFVKTTYSMKQGGDSQTLTSGALGYGLADTLVNAMKAQAPDSSTSVTVDQASLNVILEELSPYIGFAKSNNKYYVSFDVSSLTSLVSASTGVSMTLKGKIYAELAFTKDNKFSSFNLEVKDVSLSMSNPSTTVQQGELKSINLSLNGKCSIKEFKGDVAAPTQAEINELGYEKISKIEIASY